MPDPLKKVRAGDPLNIPATAYNAFVDAALAARRGQLDRAGGPIASRPDAGIILVSNATGTDLDRFGVVGLDAPIIDPADNADGFAERPAMSGVTPTAEHAGRFGVLLEPIADGAVGRAVVAGVTVCRITLASEAHTHAVAAVDATAALASADGGDALILWHEPGTGELWAIIRIGAGGGDSVGSGQYQGMVLQKVGQNQRGWDFVRAATIPE